MFIKKDLRKIPRILADAAPSLSVDENTVNVDRTVTAASNSEDEPAAKRAKRELLTELRLSRRNSEFHGSLKILCQPTNAPSLQHLVSLSLYDCQIRSLDGIGMLGEMAPKLQELNVGRNPLSKLPDELVSLSSSLRVLWCDDCQLEGFLPACIGQLTLLETLRVSNNKLTNIHGDTIRNLQNLKTLCLDGNQLENLPPELAGLCDLQKLLVRNNKIQTLPDGVPGAGMTDLTLLHLSSNELRALPQSIVECTSLQQVYLNSNKLMTLPDGMASALVLLKRLTLSHNCIEAPLLPKDFVERFGQVPPPHVEPSSCADDEQASSSSPKSVATSTLACCCDLDPTCVVTLACNPILKTGSRVSTAGILNASADAAGDGTAIKVVDATIVEE